MNLLSTVISLEKVLLVVGIVAVLAIVFSLLIVLVSKLCYVKEDERVKTVQENLAGANCGGCGFAGCSDFAKALVEGKTDLSKCSATANENKEVIAKVLGIPFCASAKNFAVVCCNGGNNAKSKFVYVGNKTCEAKNAYMGGDLVCSDGCLGEGSCATVCAGDGVMVKDGVAVIDTKLCEGCGACVYKCPKSLIKLIPNTAKVYVACSSKCKGKTVMDACSVGCIGCGLCAKVCPNGAIEMVDNLPVIDYSKCTGCKLCKDKCPKKCIKEI